jgi:glycerol-1-phosphate dehydrogenase [NAD(P)+]
MGNASYNSPRIKEYLRISPETRAVVIGQGVLGQLPSLIEQHFGKCRARIVADENTYAAAGGAVYDHLVSADMIDAEPMIFPGRPHLLPDFENVLKIQEWLGQSDSVPVSVGSGTLNDLTKLASYRLGREYVTVATAASMDGYASSGSPIVTDGYKKTINAAAARVILADTDVLVGAPTELTAAGYADLLGKVTSGADWILVDELGIDPIDSRGWDMVQPHLAEWTDQPEAVANGDPAAFAGLLEGLTLCGLAMQVTGSTRPASGAEHQIGHLWEMAGVEYAGEHMLHGFTVALGSIVVAGMYEYFLAQNLGQLDIGSVVSRWPSADWVASWVHRELMDYLPIIADRAVQESLNKYISADVLQGRLRLLVEHGPALRSRLEAQMLPAGELKRRFEITGCPTAPREYGLSREDMRKACVLARQTRNRYTILDLLAEMGQLEAGVEYALASGRIWDDEDWRQR